MKNYREWQVGERVALYDGHSFVAFDTVERVTKSGRPVINDITFNPDGGQRGGDTWSKLHIEPLTPDLEAEIEAMQRERQAWIDWIDAYQSVKRGAFPVEKLEFLVSYIRQASSETD